MAGVVAAVREPATVGREGAPHHAARGGDGRPLVGVRHRHLGRHPGGGGGGGEEEDRAEPPPPQEVVKAVVAAMQGECSMRGRCTCELQLRRGAAQPARRAGAPLWASSAGRASSSSTAGQHRRGKRAATPPRTSAAGRRAGAPPQAHATEPARPAGRAGEARVEGGGRRSVRREGEERREEREGEERRGRDERGGLTHGPHRHVTSISAKSPPRGIHVTQTT
jgi:hypothetical protein